LAYLFNGKNALASDLAHVYDNIETQAVFSFTAADFAETTDMSSFNTTINNANVAKEGVKISPNGAGIISGFFWATQESMDTLNAAITEAQAIVALRGTGYTLTAINSATATLNNAITTFINSRSVGAYIPGLDGDIGLYVDSASSPETTAGKTLAAAMAWLQANGTNNKEYTILLGNDETLNSWTLGGSSSGTAIALDGKTDITLTLKGKSAERIVQLGGQGSLFTIMEGVILVLDENITIKGISNNNAPLVYVSGTNAKFEIKAGSKITDNISSSSGGGVYVSGGTFTMSGGTISGNTASSGGGVFVSGSVYASVTFTMSGGTISDNTAAAFSPSLSSGGGVYVGGGGTFTMSGGTISGNAASYNSSSSYSSYGGGVYVGSGIFTMSGGTISGNTASYSSSYGGGVYVDGGTFIMRGAARVALNNPVYIPFGKKLIIGGVLSGSDPVAALDMEANVEWIGKTLIQWEEGQSGTLPVDRFSCPSSYTVNSLGIVSSINATLLSLGTPGGAWLAQGDVHYYRIAATINRTYSITRSGDQWDNFRLSEAYHDGTVIFSDASLPTPSSFIAARTGDVIIMVSGGNGAYTLGYTEQ
jgi:hypothetical protein